MHGGWSVLLKARLNWESGESKTGAFEKRNGFQPATILRRRVSTRGEF
jgi:hypothetical protein